MSRRPLVYLPFPVGVFLLVAGFSPDGRSVEEVPLQDQTAQIDSARSEMAVGRYWHAARRLQVAFPQGPGEDRILRILMARAEAGWRNWRGVGTLLGAASAPVLGDSPEGWYLLGRALEGEGLWASADSAYSGYLSAAAEDSGDTLLEVRARRGRMRIQKDQYVDAMEDVRAILAEDSILGGWVALEVAERAAEAGAREATRIALAAVAVAEVRRTGWALPATALLSAGDSTGAEAAFWSALPGLSSPGEKAEAWDRVGVLRLARGDSMGARGAFHQVLALSPSGSRAVRAAEALLSLGLDSMEVAVTGARALYGAGRYEEALRALDRYEELTEGAAPGWVRLIRARCHLGLGESRMALEIAAQLVASDEPTLGLPALMVRMDALRRLGRSGEVGAVQEELVSRFPDSDEAVDVLFQRATALQDRGDMDGAILGYQAAAGLAPARNMAGEARMKLGHLLLDENREEEALAVFQGYMEDFPAGRRWDQAAFWRGWVLFSQGREEEGREILIALRREEPLSYFAVVAGDLLDEVYDPPIPFPPDSLPFPQALRGGLARIDRLRAAGMEEGATWEVENLAGRIRESGDQERRLDGLLRLALELNARGLTREGINLGWEVRNEGRPLDRDLLAAIYPFPYQNILLAEARERGVDPFLLAGLIRQESAFWLDARSRADARGLMQVLPATGAELARSQGPAGFRADDHLFDAEINIHLGTAFFVDMRRRFGDNLPIILSAYNAGPTRANRWRQFPEAGDPPRFVERIPFSETRGYVRNVTANRAIYNWLYGGKRGVGEVGGEPVPLLP